MLSQEIAVDSQGNDTTNPNEALKGALKSSGDYKGWGFGLMTEVLAAAYTGSVNSLDVKGLKLRQGKPHDLGQCYISHDPSTHGRFFVERMEKIITAVREQEGTR